MTGDKPASLQRETVPTVVDDLLIDFFSDGDLHVQEPADKFLTAARVVRALFPWEKGFFDSDPTSGLTVDSLFPRLGRPPLAGRVSAGLCLLTLALN
ncbi:MAG: hypothetical protein LBP95_09285 [Deltaproteobacteria bacterium]|nr:hypothetical protein [Deltaproteobacteria bacterium]